MMIPQRPNISRNFLEKESTKSFTEFEVSDKFEDESNIFKLNKVPSFENNISK